MSDPTLTSLANRALDYLGRGPSGNIDAPNPKTELERRMKARIDDAITQMLRLDRWPAALTTASLAGSSLDDDRYYFLVTLPTDCVHVWRVAGRTEIPARLETRSFGLYYDDDDYGGRYGWERRSGQGAGSIACNFTPPVTVEYAKRLAPAQMTEEMQDVVAIILANMVMHHAALATARRQELMRMKIECIKTASRVSGSEDGPDRPFGSPWLDAMWGP